MHPFSPAGRAEALRRMGREALDLLVIGGGITGCGLAREATLRGLKVGLVEKVDFGYGTSSRSSKLVHGGLRYLAQGDLPMVWESVRERHLLRQIAPHLLHPLSFVYPIYRGDRPFPVQAALRLIELIDGADGLDRHRRLSAAEVWDRAPALGGPVTGGLAYQEFQTDDARLTLENALSAAQHGALAANHAAVTGLVIEKGRVAGARVRDHRQDQEIEVRAKVVVNATGPWAEEILQLGPGTARARLIPTKGIHLRFSVDRLPLTGALVLRAANGRQGFAIRRWDSVYVGTTDESHQGALDQPHADQPAVQALLGLVQECFEDLRLTEGDITATWAGLRPLVAEPGKNQRNTSRHDRIWRSPDGLITVAGGKLTTYRRMAQRILKAVAQALNQTLIPPPRPMPLPGAELHGQEFAAYQQATWAALRARGVPEDAAERITWLYGSRVEAIISLGDKDPTWLEPLAPDAPALRAEVKIAVEQEMAIDLVDFLDRRSSLLLFAADQGRSAAEPASLLMADLLGWGEAERVRQVDAYLAIATAHSVR